MRFFILTLLVRWALSLTAPPVVIAGPFTSPFVKHGIVAIKMNVVQEFKLRNWCYVLHFLKQERKLR
jgi:hypothetical protein